MRRRFIVIVFALSLPLIAAAAAPINKSLLSRLALKGYDPVSYFTEGKPTKGDKAFEFEWMDAVWRFSSAQHRDLFAADPEEYAPQYGGYCAYAVSEGDTASISPDAWKIVNGKLYLNYNRKIQAAWEKNHAERIGKADRNWPDLLKK